MLNRVSDKVQSILQAAGLKVATQKYEYTSAGIKHQGENAYAIIHAPRGDATEAIVLVAAWKTADDELNLNGVTLALTLARYFKSGFCVDARRGTNADSSQDGHCGPRISFS
jgi:glycosylphosphatidylinositol transamidase